MSEKVMILIPAKGNSRRISSKNKQKINDKTLVEYAIIRSEKSKLGDIFVSTNDEEIIETTNKYNPEYVIKRPDSLCGDNIRSIEVCLHAIKQKEQNGYTTFIMTFPTSPLSNEEDLIKAYDLFLKSNRQSVISVNRYEGNNNLNLSLKEIDNFSHISYMDNKPVSDLIKSGESVYYRGDGSVFIADINRFLIEKEVFMKDAIAYIVPQERALDVNTPFDLKIARLLMSGK